MRDKKLNIVGILEVMFVAIFADYMFFMHSTFSARVYFILEIIGMVLWLFKNNMKVNINGNCLFALLLIAMEVGITASNNRITYSYVCLVIAEVMLVLFITECIVKKKELYMLVVFEKALFILYVLDVISVIICLITGIHENASFGLVGHKNYHSFLFILTITFRIINNECLRKKMIDTATFVMTIIAIITEIVVDSASGAVALIVLFVLCFFINKRKFPLLNIYTIMIGLIVINFVIIFAMGVSDVFSILFSIIGRDAGLSGRSVMWKLAFQLIEQKPWFGYGFAKEVRYFNPGTSSWVNNHCHNFFINIQLTGGVVYSFVYSLFMLKAFREIKKNSGRISRILTYGLGCYLLLGISEIIVNVNAMFIPLLLICIYIGEINNAYVEKGR